MRENTVIDKFTPEHLEGLLFPMLTVYFNPADFPGKYVVRLFDMDKPTRFITISDTLTQARYTLAPIAYRLTKAPYFAGQEDPCIVETYF